SDLDGDDLTVTRVEASDGVTAELHQGGVLVTPEDGFSGDATVSYTISDGNGGTGTAEIAVTVEAPEEPEEPVDPPETPGGETVMAFVESDGAVLIEAESYGDLPAGWVTRADYDKDAAPNLGALGGKNDFVMWQGADQSDAPGEAILTYYVVIETPGLYEFDLRDQPATDRPEVGGDTWVKIDGAQFYGLDDESTMYPEGAEPGSYPDGSVMLPVADGEDGWMRYQSTNRSTHWGSGGHVNDTGNRRDRHDIVVEFDAPGVYAIQLSGATPSSHAIGSFGLVNREVASEFSLQGEQSERREVALEDSGATPPPDPAPEPEPEPEPTPALEVGFSVVNGTTDIVVDPALIDGEEIDGQGANIVATPNIPVGSAVFSLNGEAIQTENAAPYAAFGNRGDDFAAGDLETGAHTLSVEFFEGNGGSGASLGTSTVSFTVATPEPEPAPDPEPAPEPGMPFAVLPEDHDTPLASAVYDAETGVLSLVFDYDKVLRDPEHNNARHIDGIVVNGTAFEMELHPDDGPRDANGFIYDETTVENAFDIDVGPLDIGDGVEILLTNNPDGRGVYYSFTLEPSEEVPEPAPNMAPEAEDDAVTIPFGSEAEVNVLGNDTDPDGDTLSITAIDASDGVTAELHQGGILVTPEPGFSGPATVAYTISDGKGGSDTAQINVTVAERPNRAPDAGDDSIDLAFGSRSFVSVLRNDTDPDGDDLTITSVEASDGLTAIVRGPDILVGPEEGFSGDGRVIYTVSDGRGGTDTAQVFVTVAPEPEPEPELEVGFTLMNGDSDTVVDADLTDGEVISGEAVNIAATPNMEVGSAVFHLNGERVQLENVDPYALFGNTGQNYAAVDLDPGVYELEVEFFSQSRGRGESLGTSALTFEVEAEEPENTAPEARDDTAALEHGGELLVDVLDNDMDADGDALSILSVESSDGLQAAIRGDTVRVVADEGFSGDGVVSYTVSDGKGGIDSAEIAVTVAEPEAPAMFEAALYTTGNRRDVELLGLENGATIDSEAFSAEGNVTFALFSTDAAPEIGSVTLSYQGKTQVENVDPYALFGNLGENFLGGTEFAEGTHEIEVTVHSEELGEGEEIDAFTFEFEVV
ncbi:MAG: cadherin-like domain-containing protein, partial [Pseudomonadota bacterium]